MCAREEVGSGSMPPSQTPSNIRLLIHKYGVPLHLFRPFKVLSTMSCKLSVCNTCIILLSFVAEYFIIFRTTLKGIVILVLFLDCPLPTYRIGVGI